MLSYPNEELRRIVAACKGSVAAVGLFSCFANFLLLVPSFYMLQVYDRVVTTGSQETLAALTLLLVFLLGTYGALEWVRSRIMVRVGNRLDALLGGRVYRALFERALATGGRKSGSQALNDLTGVRQFLAGNGLFAFFDIPWLPIYIFVMFLFHPWFGWVAVLSALLLMCLAVINERVTGPLLAKANSGHVAASLAATRQVENAEVIASMGMLGRLEERWQGQNRVVTSLQSVASDRAVTMTALSKVIRLTVQSLILGVGALLAIRHEISPGLMIAGSILLGRALAPIDLLIATWKGFSTARSQYQRLTELLRETPPDRARMELPAPTGAISVEGLVVAGPGTRTPIIKGITMAVEAGESIGILGASASGKSTLARALLGVWPAMAGTVRLDGAEITAWDREQLGPHVGYLPQDIELFEGTIAENIARFGSVDAEAVVAAAQLAGVHELILRLPDGYDTVIGPQGGSLSGGQRQRIGLARAVYGEPRVVVLDEPNSNLDEAGELALASALQQLREKKVTVFVITHRPSILAQVGQVAVMHDGRMLAFGPTEKVLAQLRSPRPNVAPITARTGSGAE